MGAGFGKQKLISQCSCYSALDYKVANESERCKKELNITKVNRQLCIPFFELSPSNS